MKTQTTASLTFTGTNVEVNRTAIVDAYTSSLESSNTQVQALSLDILQIQTVTVTLVNDAATIQTVRDNMELQVCGVSFPGVCFVEAIISRLRRLLEATLQTANVDFTVVKSMNDTDSDIAAPIPFEPSALEDTLNSSGIAATVSDIVPQSADVVLNMDVLGDRSDEVDNTTNVIAVQEAITQGVLGGGAGGGVGGGVGGETGGGVGGGTGGGNGGGVGGNAGEPHTSWICIKEGATPR